MCLATPLSLYYNEVFGYKELLDEHVKQEGFLEKIRANPQHPLFETKFSSNPSRVERIEENLGLATFATFGPYPPHATFKVLLATLLLP